VEEDGDDDEDDDGDCNDFSQWTLFGLLDEADLKHETRWLPVATNSETSWSL
jgi:hypothetical protein